MIWNGHTLVSSGHPEDDDPYCSACGLPADAPEAMDPCRRTRTLTMDELRDSMEKAWTWPAPSPGTAPAWETPDPMDRIVSGIPSASVLPLDDRTDTERAMHRVWEAEEEVTRARMAWTETLPTLTPELACSKCGRDDSFTLITGNCASWAKASAAHDDTDPVPYLEAIWQGVDPDGDVSWLRCDAYESETPPLYGMTWCYTEHRITSEVEWV